MIWRGPIPLLTRLQTTLTQHQSNYARLLGSYEGIRLAEVQAMDNIVVAEPAKLPKYPIKPRKLQNTLLAAVLDPAGYQHQPRRGENHHASRHRNDE